MEKVRPIARLDNVYTDISSSFSYVTQHEPLYDVLREYDPSHVFFGSDYPIWCPKKERRKAEMLQLPDGFRLEDILFHNFARFYHYQSL